MSWYQVPSLDEVMEVMEEMAEMAEEEDQVAMVVMEEMVEGAVEKAGLDILPPFRKDETRLANIEFTQFFWGKAPFSYI